jgi:3-dehydroquinate synthase
MKEIDIIIGSSNSKILLGESLDNLKNYVGSNAVVVTEQNVLRNLSTRFPELPVIVLDPGEKGKSFANVEYISSELLKLNVDRDTTLIGIGGGAVLDVTGFVASIFYRGIPFAYVPTSLVAQIDASIGGKTGINFEKYKNIIGTFNQPKFILIDILILNTLPRSEMINGMAEMIKTAIISDVKLFENIENKYNDIIDLKLPLIEDIVAQCANFKASIVMKDERELNIRRILNFGHTFGHAVESITGLSHGHSVSLGMVEALKVSVFKTGLSVDIMRRTTALLQKTGLLVELELNRNDVFDSLVKDKKRYGDKIKFVLLKNIGEPVIQDIEIKELEKIYYDLR